APWRLAVEVEFLAAPGVRVREQVGAGLRMAGVAGEPVEVVLVQAFETVLVAAVGLVLDRPVVQQVVGHGLRGCGAGQRGGDRRSQFHSDPRDGGSWRAVSPVSMTAG